jgi:hypothetical protein
MIIITITTIILLSIMITATDVLMTITITVTIPLAPLATAALAPSPQQAQVVALLTAQQLHCKPPPAQPNSPLKIMGVNLTTSSQLYIINIIVIILSTQHHCTLHLHLSLTHL